MKTIKTILVAIYKAILNFVHFIGRMLVSLCALVASKFSKH